jgi:hypothetical protein
MSLVNKPVLALKTGDAEYELWVLNPGQTCQITNASCHEFTAKNTASLIYVRRDTCRVFAEETNLDDLCIWTWIQAHMQTGMAQSIEQAKKERAKQEANAPELD